MDTTRAHRLTPILFLLVAAGFLLARAGAGGEVTALHLVYEKAVKMKRIETEFLLSFRNQSLASDSGREPRRLDCRVTTLGASGPLPATGRLELGLLGTTRRSAGGSQWWRSGSLAVDLGNDGTASFTSAEIADLAAAADAAGASINLFRVVFDGGKGKKVAQLTVDCLQESEDP